jgi:hypothetical protein
MTLSGILLWWQKVKTHVLTNLEYKDRQMENDALGSEIHLTNKSQILLNFLILQ